jgi:hypothetical protein
MSFDTRLLNILKDDFFQLVIFLSCIVLLLVGYLGGLPTLASWLPWVWVGFIVSGCALAVTVLSAFLGVRS